MGDASGDMAVARHPEGTELTPAEAALAAELEQTPTADAADEAV
ncbi:hypothetical protein [Streptomyces sp. XD-27]|nr:hypothetical protein [Streptomyces sp. XD-27]WKX71160.1 hypothetical protein Q3Y56_15670 [Streptomyces sp. XD-27]